jgi:hypothetical protein
VRVFIGMCDSEALLVTEFVNLKIKSTQFFKGAHRGRICVRAFIGMCAYTYISIYICTVFLKKSSSFLSNPANPGLLGNNRTMPKDFQLVLYYENS